jgi:Carboxypeptidase regulatory-like domain
VIHRFQILTDALEPLMKRKRNLSAMIMAGFLLLPTGTVWAQVSCNKEPSLKPVRCLCGKLIDQSGAPVSEATVKVIKDGQDLETVKTAGDGKFIFAGLKSGSYELTALTEDFKIFRSPIVVANPAKKCKRGLVIVLVLYYPDNCGSYVMKR